ncbi:hypothetical protein GCM10027413_27920 [Conyzicola nivalis]|uniref:Gram-positive cocci surface proteins LPxTG domain-containing protein n=1 Tax=Conyzicola nivalis TaxID=1477021 RepID=A0A916ST77_9MICO|nr:hypothetical protein [Conyzicola nivalis]GGB14682.1 hypothetical protein GCM10010979_31590 [Conyzicola nivalis]
MSPSARLPRRLAVATIAVASLLFAVIGAGPASAIDLPFAVTAPAEGSTAASRTPVFSGNGFEGATVTVTPTAGQADAVTTTVLPDGTWTTGGVAYGVTATATQQAVVTHTTFGGVTDSITVSFALPPVATAGSIVITSPANGTTLDSSLLTVTGTAPVGSVISYFFPLGSGDGPPSTLTVGSTGTFALEFVVPYENGNPYDFVFEGVTAGGLPLAPATLTFSPARFLAAPTIITPAPGASLVGSSVTFTGTGVPGRSVIVSAYVPGLPLGEFERYSRVSPEAVIDAQGRWTTSIALLPATYTVFASLVEVEGDGGFVISDPSPEFRFTLAAGTAPTGTAPAELANTGFDAGIVLPAGVVLLLGGCALVLTRRRLAAE